MAACETFYFHGISPRVFESVSKQLAEKGFTLTGPVGVVHGPFGIVFAYNWNQESETLAVEVVEKSFFISCDQIREQLASALGKNA